MNHNLVIFNPSSSSLAADPARLPLGHGEGHKIRFWNFTDDEITVTINPALGGETTFKLAKHKRKDINPKPTDKGRFHVSFVSLLQRKGAPSKRDREPIVLLRAAGDADIIID